MTTDRTHDLEERITQARTPRWLDLDAIVPAGARDMLTEARDEVLRLLPEIMRVATLADHAMLNYEMHLHDAKVPTDVSDVVCELSGWSRLFEALSSAEEWLAEAREPARVNGHRPGDSLAERVREGRPDLRALGVAQGLGLTG